MINLNFIQNSRILFLLISCFFIINDQVYYASEDDAMAAARKGNIWAVVIFPQNFSSSLEARLEDPRGAEEDIIDSSIVDVHMDVSS